MSSDTHTKAVERFSLLFRQARNGSHELEPEDFPGEEVFEDLAIALRSVDPPYPTVRFRSLMEHIAENQPSKYVDVLQILFCKENLFGLSNQLHFVSSISRHGRQALRECAVPAQALSLIKDWFAVPKPVPCRLVFDSDLTNEEREILELAGILIPTVEQGLSEITTLSPSEYTQALSDVPRQSFSWGPELKSEVIPDSIVPATMSLLCHWIERGKEEIDDNAAYLSAWDRLKHNAYEVLNVFYRYYRERYAAKSDLDDLERLHHFVWFVLRYLADDSEEGLFRPYAEINSRNTDLLVDYLLLDPTEHLQVFLLHNREAQYSALTEYGIHFNGRESMGSSISGVGHHRTLDDVPFAEYLLQPALASMFEEYSATEDRAAFWSVLKEDWLKPELPVSSLCPAVLRRACAPMMAKLGAEANPEIANDVFATIGASMLIGEGVPDTSSKIFSELREHDTLFRGDRAYKMLELVKKDINNTWCATPSNFFAFHCLLKLAGAGLPEAGKILEDLLDNPYIVEHDKLEYDILPNIEGSCGLQSPIMETAISKYLNNTAWQENASFEANSVLQRWFAANSVRQPADIDQAFNSQNRLVREAVPKMLLELAQADFLEFAHKVDDLSAGRLLHDVFTSRRFITEAIDALFAKHRDSGGTDQKTPEVDAASNLLNEAVQDPDPPPRDERDQKVRSGEKDSSIVGTRTHACFTVTQFSRFRPYYAEAWAMTKRLLQDESYYVRYYAFVALIEILRRRTWHSEVARESVEILWQFFNDTDLPACFEKLLLRCFLHVRDISEDQAQEVLDRFSDVDGVETLYLFYALFRRDFVDTMGSFDTNRFEKKLTEAITGSSGTLPRRILHGIWNMTRENIEYFERGKPYLLMYQPPLHSNSEIVGQAMLMSEKLLNKLPDENLADAIEVLIHFQGLEKTMLSSQPSNDGAFWIHGLGPEATQRLYDADKAAFYRYLSLLADCVELGKRSWYEEELFNILNEESNTQFVPVIEAFWNEVVAAEPRCFPLKQKWLDSRSLDDSDSGVVGKESL